ncbi:MFS transporter [Plantactinospora sp. GCM10030261]|uniref:MFS transporter n=1 Tax=Plantactinospora sp. GCM10030261 TaxID=3273420 RepID=UPI0036145A38
MTSRLATVPTGSDATGGHRPEADGRRVVTALAITQTVGYGTLYYSFAVLLEPMATSLSASAVQVTGALTASVLTGGAMAVPVGRWLDRHGGHLLMTVGSLVGTLLVAAWSRVGSLAELYAVLVGVGLVSGMVLYESAFAVIVSWFDPERRARALLAVTAVAGLASSIYLPLTGLLVDRLGWRTALLVLAAVHGVVTIPLHATAIRRPPSTRRAAGATDPIGKVVERRRTVVRAAVRDVSFWTLTAAFVFHSAAMATMAVHLVSYLTSRGHPPTFGATVAGLLGILAVTGRFVLSGTRNRLRTTRVVALMFAFQALAVIGLGVFGDSRGGAVAAVVCFGLGFGLAHLATPTLLASRYGTAAYATIAGIVATPVTLARAAAPMLGASMIPAGGYSGVLATVAACCAVAGLCLFCSADHAPPRRDRVGFRPGRPAHEFRPPA